MDKVGLRGMRGGREGAKYGEDIERNDDDSFFIRTLGLMIIS